MSATSLALEASKCALAASMMPSHASAIVATVERVASAPTVSYCQVSAILSAGPGSSIGVVYRLPSTWNGKVLGLGGGGFAGNVRPETAVPALRRGYATMQTDAGHPSTSVWDTKWAVSEGKPNVPAIEDFAYRAVHEMTSAGKFLAARYYGKLPARAYFQGCSQGGRQGMEEAQRYPDDYDGIVSGAPAFDHIGSIASQSISSRAFRAEASLLTSDQVFLVHTAVLKACDALDGAVDGIVQNPASCGFDPGVLLCRDGVTTGCLFAPQVAAVRMAYTDQRTASGKPFVYGLARGSELTSIPMYQGMRPLDAQEVEGVNNLAPALGFPSDINLKDNNVKEDLYRSRNSVFANLIQADNPDLSEYVARGGKLLFWHGMYDQLLSFRRFTAYFDEADRVTSAQLAVAPGAPRFDKSVRLFALAGVGHCSGDIGPAEIDLLTAIEQWVERATPPTELLATKVLSADMKDPVAKNSPVLSRPACMWPSLPMYNGKGNVNIATSFTCPATTKSVVR